MLLSLWLIFSGKYDLFHIGAGVLSVLLILWLDRRLGSATLERADVSVAPYWGLMCLYLPWLAWQMVLSSWQVARVVLSPRILDKVEPTVVEFSSALPHEVARVALGNSITLTPGTLTLDIVGDRFVVHSLSGESTQSLLEGTMQRKVAELYRTKLDEPVTGIRILRDRQRI